jgi:hypothetical protein
MYYSRTLESEKQQTQRVVVDVQRNAAGEMKNLVLSPEVEKEDPMKNNNLSERKLKENIEKTKKFSKPPLAPIKITTTKPTTFSEEHFSKVPVFIESESAGEVMKNTPVTPLEGNFQNSDYNS